MDDNVTTRSSAITEKPHNAPYYLEMLLYIKIHQKLLSCHFQAYTLAFIQHFLFFTFLF